MQIHYIEVLFYMTIHNGISLPMDLVFKYQSHFKIGILGLVVNRLAFESGGPKFDPCLGANFLLIFSFIFQLCQRFRDFEDLSLHYGDLPLQ